MKNTIRLITQTCNSLMPWRRQRQGRRQAYWWNDQTAILRRGCLRLRCLAQRARDRPDATEKSARHKAAESALGYEIR